MLPAFETVCHHEPRYWARVLLFLLGDAYAGPISGYGSDDVDYSDRMRKRMGSGDHPGLQNRREASSRCLGCVRLAHASANLKHLAWPACRFRAVKSQSHYLAVSLAHLIRYHIPVNVHRGSDVCVTH